MSKKMATVAAILMIMMMVISGCGSQPAAPPATTPPASSGGAAATPPATDTPAAPAERTFLSIVTATSGGTFYVVGAKMADMINSSIANTQATAEVTAGGVENARLIKAGNADLATMPSDTLYNAVNGVAEFADDGKIPLMLIASLYSTPLQIATIEKTGITTMEQLRGKRVSIGAPGSSASVRAEIVLNAHGMTLDDINVDTTTTQESVQQLTDGTIDVTCQASGAPMAALMDLASKEQIVMIDLEADALAKIEADHPYLYGMTIPAGTYQGMEKDNIAIANTSTICCRADMPEELIYEITKLIIEDQENFKTAHAALGGEFTPELAASGEKFAPYHPGAVRYYQEIGLMQ